MKRVDKKRDSGFCVSDCVSHGDGENVLLAPLNNSINRKSQFPELINCPTSDFSNHTEKRNAR